VVGQKRRAGNRAGIFASTNERRGNFRLIAHCIIFVRSSFWTSRGVMTWLDVLATAKNGRARIIRIVSVFSQSARKGGEAWRRDETARIIVVLKGK